MFHIKLLRKLKSEITKHEATLIFFVLIFLAYCLGLWSSKTSDEYITYVRSFAVMVFGSMISIGMINSVLDSLVSSENKKIRKEIESLNGLQYLDNYNQQEEEYLSLIPKKYADGSNIHNPSNLLEDIDIKKRQKYIVRETIIRSLDVITIILRTFNDDNENDPLWSIAMAGATEVLGQKARNFTIKAITSNKDTQSFLDNKDIKDFLDLTHNIYIFLKAWLMISIKYGRPMNYSIIKRKFPNSYYIKALTFIKTKILKSPKVYTLLQSTNSDITYINGAQEMLDYYLAHLIVQLKKNPGQDDF